MVSGFCSPSATVRVRQRGQVFPFPAPSISISLSLPRSCVVQNPPYVGSLGVRVCAANTHANGDARHFYSQRRAFVGVRTFWGERFFLFLFFRCTEPRCCGVSTAAQRVDGRVGRTISVLWPDRCGSQPSSNPRPGKAGSVVVWRNTTTTTNTTARAERHERRTTSAQEQIRSWHQTIVSLSAPWLVNSVFCVPSKVEKRLPSFLFSPAVPREKPDCSPRSTLASWQSEPGLKPRTRFVQGKSAFQSPKVRRVPTTAAAGALAAAVRTRRHHYCLQLADGCVRYFAPCWRLG